MFFLFVSFGNHLTEDNRPLKIYHQLELQITVGASRKPKTETPHREKMNKSYFILCGFWLLKGPSLLIRFFAFLPLPLPMLSICLSYCYCRKLGPLIWAQIRSQLRHVKHAQKKNHKRASTECLAHARCSSTWFEGENVSQPHRNSMGANTVIIVFISQGKSLRHREVKQLTQGHTAC